MGKGKNIHIHIRDEVGMAKFYAEDGAFRTAADILRKLADDIDRHVAFCDRAAAGLLAKYDAENGGRT